MRVRNYLFYNEQKLNSKGFRRKKKKLKIFYLFIKKKPYDGFLREILNFNY